MTGCSMRRTALSFYGAIALAGLALLFSSGCATTPAPCLDARSPDQGLKLGTALGVLTECWADGRYCSYFIDGREVVVRCNYGGCRPADEVRR